MEKDFKYYMKLMRNNNKLPDNFDQWLLSNSRIILAHEAAKIGILPTDWTDKVEHWLIDDECNDTVAHHAASQGILETNWTDNQEDWSALNYDKQSIGLLFSSHSTIHYNNPSELEDYCKNINDHLLLYLENNIRFIDQIDLINNFLKPFIDKIMTTEGKVWIETSEQYSGFLIDHVESTVESVQNKLRFNIPLNELSKIEQKDDLINSIQKLLNFIKEQKIYIKEELFKKTTSKNEVSELYDITKEILL